MKKSIGARTIVYPTPVLIIGTYDQEGKPNVMNAAWGGICSSGPPSVAVSIRKSRHTHANITVRKAFTVSIPSEEHLQAADYFGIATGKTEDKFAVTGLTPVPSKVVAAPYVEEFPLVLECRLLKTVELGVHTQFVGEILDVKVEESVLMENGIPDIEKVKPFLFAPDRLAYYGIGSFLGNAFSEGKALQRKK